MLAPDAALDLDAFAELFDGVAADTDPARLPLLLKVEGAPATTEAAVVGTRPLDGEHPGPILLGFQAPPEWSVLGVASIGWSLPPERSDEADLDRHTFTGRRPSEDPDRVRVRSVVLVDRSGRIGGCITADDGETVRGGPSTGALVDVLLRAMGCSTPPPAIGTLELFALQWLSEVVGAADAGGGPLTWRKAEALHPALRLLTAAGERRGETLEAAGRALANVCGWAELRWQVIERGWTGAGCSPAEALWFDEGSFARWAVGSYPALDVLVRRCDDALVPSAARRARQVLRAWDLIE